MNGDQFPAKTLYEICMYVQFHLESVGYMWQLLADARLMDLKFTLDNTMKERCSQNIGGPVKKAEVLSHVDIDILWENGFLGEDNPNQLLTTVFFMIGMSCALRAGKEHQKLHSIPFNSQFEWKVDDSGRHYLKYCKDLGMKTNKGGLKHRKLEAKCVNVYPILGSSRCPVMLIMKYFSLLPSEYSCRSLYLQPKKKFTSECWYLDKPVGINRLQSMVHEVCKDAGLPGFYTNNSLRATAATRMYHSDIDEQIIQEVTGHRSVAVREYKRTCDDQKLVASSCIMGVESDVKPPKCMKYSQ